MMSMPEMQVADVQMQFMQRPNQRLGLGAPPKMRTKGPPARKTPFMLLNEHYPLLSRLINIEDVSASTTGHRFRCTATIAEKMFVGEGSNKKEAKQAMAERAVHDLLPHLAGSLANYAPVPPPVNFASSDHHDYDMNFDGSADITASFPQTDNAASQQVPKVAPESQHESPLAKLKRLCAEREAADGVKYSPQFECVDISPPEAKPHEKIFKYVLTMTEQGKVFEEEGQNKKNLQQGVIKAALRDVFNVEDNSAEMIAMEKPLKLKSDNPISMLNEACSKRGLKMKTTVETVDGLPVGPQSRYKCIIDLGEKGQFETEGPSKKGAKTAVACQILDQVFGVKAREFNLDTVMKSPAERKPPVQLLFELCQIQGGESKTVAYEFVEEIVMGKTPHYVMKVRVGEQEFVGQGMSKKLAKTQAAREALRVLFLVETPDPSLKNMVPTKRSFASAMVGEDGARADWPMPKMQRFSIQTSSDVISSLVLNKYLQLCTQHRIPPTSYLAGFVLTQGPALCDGQVVSLASGAKATTYAAVVGQKGLALIDSHAEVLARRGLILFFYQQLEMLADALAAPNSIFETVPGGRGFRLKKGYKLHFYSTLPPAGDARIPLQVGDNDNPDAKLLRCYGATEGSTVPVRSRPQQTWASLQSGEEPLCVMTVSDKMLKWSLLGLQGALLSHFLEPVFVSDVCIGSGFVQDAVVRALYGRLSPNAAVRALYGQLPSDTVDMEGNPTDTDLSSCPVVSGVSDPEHLPANPRVPSFATIWSAANPAVESILQETGNDITGKHSCVCKSVLFEHFGRLCAKKLQPILESNVSLSHYRNAKEAATLYQMAKNDFIHRAKEAGLGEWQSKPSEIEQFQLSWVDDN